MYKYHDTSRAWLLYRLLIIQLLPGLHGHDSSMFLSRTLRKLVHKKSESVLYVHAAFFVQSCCVRSIFCASTFRRTLTHEAIRAGDRQLYVLVRRTVVVIELNIFFKNDLNEVLISNTGGNILRPNYKSDLKFLFGIIKL